MTIMNQSHRTITQVPRQAVSAVWLTMILLLCSAAPAYAGQLSRDGGAVQDDSSMHAFDPKSFCEVFSPCPQLEVPISVLRDNYLEDLDMFSPVMVLVKIICDSNGLINYARTLPVSNYRNEQLSQERTQLITLIEHFFRRLIGVTTLRAEYVYCSMKSVRKCPPASEVRHPRDGSAIYLIVDIGNSYGFIPTYWLVEPSGYYVNIPVPDKCP